MAEWIRNVGIDVGVKSAHEVHALDPNGKTLRFKCGHTRDEMHRMLERLRVGLPQEATLRFIMEPTDTAWVPIAWFVTEQGYDAYLAPAQVSHDFRRALSKHAKSDRIDGATLASLPTIPMAARCLNKIVFGTKEQDLLRRLAKRDYQLATAISDRTRRIESLVRLALPSGVNGIEVTSPVGHYLCSHRLDPERVLKMDTQALAAELVPFAGDRPEQAAQAWREACQEALGIYGSEGPLDYASLQVYCRSELRFLRLEEEELAEVRKEARACYRRLDSAFNLETIPGVGAVTVVAALAALGQGGKYTTTQKFRASTGFVPRVSESGVVDSKGKHLTKAGPNWLKRPLYMAADAARKTDPQLAKVYYDQMVRYGHHHTHAVCAVATRLADRIFICHRDNRPYELRDLQGNPISPEAARTYIAEHLQVPEEVRRRLRRVSTKKKRKTQPHNVRAS